MGSGFPIRSSHLNMKILAFWSPADYEEFFRPAFLERDDVEVEVVSGDRTSQRSQDAAGPSRLRKLKGRLEEGEFDLVISGTVWQSRFATNKRFWTRLAGAARYSTYRRGRLDTDLVAGLYRRLRRKVPLGVVDLRDSNYVLPADLPLLKAATLYFKRELFAWPRRSLLPLITWNGSAIDELQKKLRPLSYGIDHRRMATSAPPMAERDIDLFVTSFGNPLRDDLARRTQALAGKYKVVITNQLLPDDEYADYLGRSKLVVCPEGFGCETWRQYDASAAGAVPLINYPFVLHHCPMEPDVHAIFFSLAGRDFEKQIDRALGNPALLQEISTRIRPWTIENKVRTRIADYVIRETLAAAALPK